MDGNEANNNQEGQDLLTLGGNPGEEGTAPQGAAVTGSEAGGDQGGEGKSFPAWHEQLKGNLKGHESLAKFDGVTALGESYLELEGKLGKSITIPGDDATDEDRANFYGKLGRPESADKYDLKYQEGFPEYLKTAMSMSEPALREELFKNGVPQKAAEGIFNWIQKELYTGEKLDQAFRQKQIKDGTSTLKEEWGADFDANMNVMGMAVRQFADAGFIKEARESGYANNPGLIRMMYKIGKAISEDSLVDGGNIGKKLPGDLLDI